MNKITEKEFNEFFLKNLSFVVTMNDKEYCLYLGDKDNKKEEILNFKISIGIFDFPELKSYNKLPCLRIETSDKNIISYINGWFSDIISQFASYSFPSFYKKILIVF